MRYHRVAAVGIAALSTVSAAPNAFMRRESSCPAGYSPSVYYVTVTVSPTLAPTPTPTPTPEPEETTTLHSTSTTYVTVTTYPSETEALPTCSAASIVEPLPSASTPEQKQVQTPVPVSTPIAQQPETSVTTADASPIAEQSTPVVTAATSTTAVSSVSPVVQQPETSATTTTTSPVEEPTPVVSTFTTSEAAPSPVSTSSTTSAAAAVSTSSTASSSSSSGLLGGSNSGQATYYTGDGVADGTCSFSTYTLPSGIFGTALSDSNWDTAAHCGACVQVTDSTGKSVKAMIVDQCPGCGENHLDLFPDAFSDLAALSVGVLDVTWSYTECGIDSPITLHAKEGSSAYWFSMQVVNSNLPVKSLEVSTDGGSTWQETTRTYYNFFNKDGGFGTETVDVRVTSENGSVVTVQGVSCSSGASVKASSNF